MDIIKIWNDKITDNQIIEATECIKSGGLAIIPTDTLYAIVADCLNSKSIERLCRLKGINPEKTNLSILCHDISMASEYAKIDNTGFNLMKQYCPGPYTFLFKTATKLPRAFKDRKVVGIRIPDCQVARCISEALGNPLISTGIAYEDDDYAINPELIAETYNNKIDLMIDAGEGSISKSTIIDCTGTEPVVIREGKGEL